ncbi:hypothetical protein PGB90_000605 [Kerria lacca]
MADCPYTKIAVMQLFYELKQKFPSIPDQVVTDFIQQASYNKEKCEKELRDAYERFQLHSYPLNIVNKMTEERVRPKTLALINNEKNASNMFEEKSKKEFVKEQKLTDCKVQGTMGNSCFGKFKCKNIHQKTGDQQQSEMTNICESIENTEISDEHSDVSACDLNVYVQNKKCNCDQNRMQLEYKKNSCGTSHSAPTTPSVQKSMSENVTTKHQSSLYIDELIKSPLLDRKRPFTTVRLTMRPPPTQPQSPVNTSTNGSNLLYTTRIYNPEVGYDNQFHIRINEEGNTTVTAFLTKTNSSIPDNNTNVQERTVSDALPALFHNALSSSSELRLQEQKKRKRRLEEEYQRDKQKLMQIQQEVKAMENDLKRREKAPFISEKVLRLRSEVSYLREECLKMYRELEPTENRLTHSSSGKLHKKENCKNSNWTCRLCTFKNHPMLPKCEQCDMARVDLTNILPTLLHPPPAQLQAIHPHV